MKFGREHFSLDIAIRFGRVRMSLSMRLRSMRTVLLLSILSVALLLIGLSIWDPARWAGILHAYLSLVRLIFCLMDGTSSHRDAARLGLACSASRENG